MYDLIIFDLDGTLVPLDAHAPYALAKRKMQTLGVPWAIATNQGRVGLREWAEQDTGLYNWLTARGLNPATMPTPETVTQRLQNVVAQLDADQPIAMAAAYAYRNSLGIWNPPPRTLVGNPAWRHDWRKPAPGMLLHIIELAGVSAQNTLYVGDRSEDKAAAEAAGCSFQWANDFLRI